MYSACINEISKSIAMDCSHPLIGGYTGRGVLIPWSSISSVTTDGTNPRRVKGIVLVDSAQAIALDNAGLINPFEGSNTTGNADSGFAMFTKTLSARILNRGIEVSKNLVEPLVRSTQGFVAILEKNDKHVDAEGSYEVIGIQSPLKVTDPTTVVRTEAENGGAISFTMVATEYYFECALRPDVPVSSAQTKYEVAREAFEALLANAYDA